jgi:hypothetical protein
MAFGMDPKLIIAHWADEATRAAATDATEAREHRNEDMRAAIARADAAGFHRRSILRRIFTRLQHPGR